ncbi:MAG TPA: hypothetical protein VMU15_21110 [Anaeromyxobacter sp.]|nr:hypothetical protein [Anaeromyxobacter sp.]
MSRLFLAMTASAAWAMSTGCVVNDSCDPYSDAGCPGPCASRTVAVGWPSFLLADHTVTSSCATAQVSTVDVYMDDQPVTSLPCSSGGVNVTGVPNNGDHRFTVEALDSTTGAIALRDEQTVSDSNCTDLLLNTQPSEGTWVLNYSFTPDLCTSATSSYIWFTLHDEIANQVIAVDGSHTPQAWTCGGGTTTPVPISLPLASGSYTLQRTEEVLYPGPAQQAGNCSSKGFDVFGATQTQVDVPLTDAVICF